MSATYPLRLEPELTRSAAEVAGKMSRSVPEQIAHWARIGRELERSPDISVADVRKVLAGAADYDKLSLKEQAVVRANWLERMTELRQGLRLDQRARAAGLRYAELDERGRVAIREPKARYRAQKKTARRRA